LWRPGPTPGDTNAQVGPLGLDVDRRHRSRRVRHGDGGSSGNLNAYGRDLRQSNAGSRDLRLAAIEGADSDKEGNSNLTEINAGAQPGWCAVAGCDNNRRTPPITNAGGPYSGKVNVGLSFNGSASSDPDGSVVGYQWNFGDGGNAAGTMSVHVSRPPARIPSRSRSLTTMA
jgi:hypothetical protein